MGKWIRRIIILVCLGVFLFSGGKILSIYHEYDVGEETYETLAAETVTENPEADNGGVPISVDFASLQAVNPDVVGWIYCEDSVIDYPILQGDNNKYYLKHIYDGTYNFSGSIFVDYHNQRGFADANTIIYGHNMKNGLMFAELDQYEDQDYYAAHPVMWLLTPEQNYKIVLFSGYTTKTSSDAYMIYSGAGEELNQYLKTALSNSDFTASDVTVTGQQKYVMLSTCSYLFDGARYVVHGILEPV